MCVGENNALHTIAYLNAQLQSLWGISSECVESRGTNMKPEPTHRYSFALAEWHFGRHRPDLQASVEDMMFHARFDAPRLDFLCNHEALFKINIADGHFNLDYSSASDESMANREQNRVITPSSTFTFRVPFQVTGIKGRDLKIGNGETTVGMVVLDLRSATLNKVEPELGSGRQAIETYLQNYLSLLQSAGHHVLFSLPNFGENTDAASRPHGPYLDFSQIAYKLLGLEDVHNVSIQHINRYLSVAWLNALILANKQPLNHPAVSLAEYRSTWAPQDDDLYFSINFGAPYVDALCNDEILIYLVLDDVRFYETGDFDTRAPFKAYSNWKIAVLMNLIHEEEGDGNIKRCRLDLASALFMPQFSEFDGRRFDDGEEDARYMNHMIDFISGEYLNFLENGQHHVIYHHDARSPGSSTIYDQVKHHEDLGLVDEIEWPSSKANEAHDLTDSKATVWNDIAQHSDMCGYDQITALSQLSINRQFRSAWSEQQSITSMTADKMLTRWGYQDRFAAIFEPLTIRLRPDGRAIVFINLVEGFLKPLENSLPNADHEKYAFTGWQVAFAVDLKMRDHVALSDASPEWLERFAQSAAHKQHGSNPDTKFEHLCLDFDRVEFLHEASRFEGLFTPTSSRSMNKVLAVVTYLRDRYLKRFAQLGHHVLYTIPVWKSRTAAPPYGLTSVAFQVHSNTTGSASNLPAAQQSQTSSPVIIFLGMCGGRSLPTSALQLSTDWVAHAGRFWTHGTGGISSAVFLRERLLPLLSAVNAVTTVVPASSTIERDGKWELELNSWAKDAQRTSRNCPFSHVPASNEEGALRYQWDHQEEFNYDQQGNPTASGVRSVSSTSIDYHLSSSTYFLQVAR
ncbi:hypothetical protein PHLGIDRAFT_509076 [Phlebiopsis gigantea 11061_1 CR5-6]|uniref:Uncharacterized protein n=1 Tax=Phlebiopsis gigantea (strain 11061_1 CR5-6) TaxID=745531 RepID=A0A0C3NSS0_PHLG1|nr:hypothetical protein PHLGIDRAFT_509076 [Phlebiopsis gigantea 11061_1 CR5-6]